MSSDTRTAAITALADALRVIAENHPEVSEVVDAISNHLRAEFTAELAERDKAIIALVTATEQLAAAVLKMQEKADG